jgi:hypothetical protein
LATQEFDEVVVIGYSQKRREVTGAVSVVDSKTLEILKSRLSRHCKELFPVLMLHLPLVRQERL